MVDLTDAEICNVIKAERERCAKIAENWHSKYGGFSELETKQVIAAEIRNPNK